MKNYIPDIYQKDIKTINYNKLKKRKIKCLIFDLDNTITNYYDNNIDKDIISLFDSLKKNFKVIILSNSTKKRVSKIANKLKVQYIPLAMKPLAFNFKRIMKRYHLSNDALAIIGDQIMTDIKGGNKVKIVTILVDPIDDKELSITKINRLIENHKLKTLSRKNILKRGNYYG